MHNKMELQVSKQLISSVFHQKAPVFEYCILSIAYDRA